MTIRVMNIRQGNIPLESVYVGRQYYDIKGSVLGNPYKIEKESQRALIIDDYEFWLREMIKIAKEERVRQTTRYNQYPIGDSIINPLLINDGIYRTNQNDIWKALSILSEIERLVELARSGDLVLVCWCYPKACHADVIKKIIEEMLDETT